MHTSDNKTEDSVDKTKLIAYYNKKFFDVSLAKSRANRHLVIYCSVRALSKEQRSLLSLSNILKLASPACELYLNGCTLSTITFSCPCLTRMVLHIFNESEERSHPILNSQTIIHKIIVLVAIQLITVRNLGQTILCLKKVKEN